MARRSVAPRGEVPFLHEKQIEAEADLLLAEYGEQREPILAPPVPLDEIVEFHLHLTLEYKDMKSLFPFADVHGAIWFDLQKIGIDQDLVPDANPSRLGRYHFTLAHEVGHWRLHRKHYATNPAERSLFADGSVKPSVVCRSSDWKKPVEWQADAFAARLLMPRKMVYAAWADFRGGDDRPVALADLRRLYAPTLAAGTVYYRGRLPTTDDEKNDAMREVFCKPFADQFQVSAEAMRIRLEQLKLFVRERTATLF